MEREYRNYNLVNDNDKKESLDRFIKKTLNLVPATAKEGENEIEVRYAQAAVALFTKPMAEQNQLTKDLTKQFLKNALRHLPLKKELVTFPEKGEPIVDLKPIVVNQEDGSVSFTADGQTFYLSAYHSDFLFNRPDLVSEEKVKFRLYG